MDVKDISHCYNSLTLADIKDNISFFTLCNGCSKYYTTNDLHVCEECKKWFCVDCGRYSEYLCYKCYFNRVDPI